MNKIFIALVVLLISGGVGITQYSAIKQKDKAKNQELSKANAIKQAKLNMASKHNAVMDWKKELEGQETEWDDLSFYYSLQVENALMKHGGRPVLIANIFLKDVLAVNRKYYLIFSGGGARYELEIDHKQVESFLKKQRDLQEYAVVASINSARKPIIEIAESRDADYKAVEINAESEMFIIKGKLIDVLCLDDLIVKEPA